MNNCNCGCNQPIEKCPTRTKCGQKWYEEYQEILCHESECKRNTDDNLDGCNQWYDPDKLYMNYYNPYGNAPFKVPKWYGDCEPKN